MLERPDDITPMIRSETKQEMRLKSIQVTVQNLQCILEPVTEHHRLAKKCWRDNVENPYPQFFVNGSPARIFEEETPESGFLTRSDAADNPFTKNPNMGSFISRNLISSSYQYIPPSEMLIPHPVILCGSSVNTIQDHFLEFRDPHRNQEAEVALGRYERYPEESERKKYNPQFRNVIYPPFVMFRKILFLPGLLIICSGIGLTGLLQAQEKQDGAVKKLRDRIRTILKNNPRRNPEERLRKLLSDKPEKRQVEVLLPLITLKLTPSRKEAANIYVSELLADLGETCWFQLKKKLDSDRPKLRAAAASVCYDLAYQNLDRETFPWDEMGKKLNALLREDPSSKVRMQAARALSAFRTRAAPYVETLLKRLEDQDSWVQWQCMEALSKAGPDAWKAIPVLRKILEKGDNVKNLSSFIHKHHLRGLAAKAFQNMGFASHEVTIPLLEICANPEFSKIHDQASSALYDATRFEQVSVPVDLLARAIRNCEDCYGTITAARRLDGNHLKIAEALTSVFENTEDHFFPRALNAVRTLDQINVKSKPLNAYLKTLATSSRKYARVWAAAAYGRVTGKRREASRMLERIIDTTSTSEERDCAVYAAGLLGHDAKNILSFIKPKTSADDPWTSLNKIKAYYRIRGKPDRYLDYVTRKMKHQESSDASGEAVDLFKLLGPLAKSSLPELKKILERKAPAGNRLRAIDAIGYIGPSRETRNLLPDLKRRLDPEVKPHPANRFRIATTIWHLSHEPQPIVNTMLDLMENRGETFFYAGDILKNLGPAASVALPRLKEHRNDRNPYYRKYASRVIRAIQQDPSESERTQREKFEQWYRDLARKDPWTSIDAVWKFVETGKAGKTFLEERHTLPHKSLKENRRHERVQQILYLMKKEASKQDHETSD